MRNVPTVLQIMKVLVSVYRPLVAAATLTGFTDLRSLYRTFAPIALFQARVPHNLFSSCHIGSPAQV